MNKKKVSLIVVGVFLLLTIVVVGAYVKISASMDDDTICKGVSIESVDVSEMTTEQAQDALNRYITEQSQKKLTVQVDNESVTSTLADLGYSIIDNDAVAQAMEIGKNGNLIKRYKEIKKVEKEKKVISLESTLDTSAVQELVKEECTKYDVPAQNASMKRENGDFVFTKHVIGRIIDVDATVEKINEALMEHKDDSADIVVTAVTKEDVPKFSADDLRQCTSVLGTATTNFADSKQARVNNVTVATNFVNGTIVYPGEIFSVYETISPITIENGYAKAGAYSNGLVVESEGGGVCQVSSTLYNTALRAELEIVERSPHSMVVSYVPKSADAAIAGTYKDLKFKNSTEKPIYIEGTINGRNVTFTVYGEEKRPENRKVEYISEVLETTQPPKDVITIDEDQPANYYKVTSPAHVGYKARLWKVVYIDGVETERTLVNASTYSASPRYITQGKEEEKKDEDDKDSEKDDGKDPDKNNEDESKDPDSNDDKKPAKPTKPSEEETDEEDETDTNSSEEEVTEGETEDQE